MLENNNAAAIYSEEDHDSFNIRAEVEKYFSYYKWFLLSVVLTVIYGFLNLKYTPRIYEVSTTILINDKDSGGGQSELSAFQDLGVMSDMRSSFDNELGILRSKDLVAQVVKDLKLNVTYYKKNLIREYEVDKDVLPFKINFLTKDSILNSETCSFKVIPISKTQFSLEDSGEESIGEFTYGATITIDKIKFILTPTKSEFSNYNDGYRVAIRSIESVAGQLKKTISIEPADVKSSLVKLSMQHGIKQKAKNILYSLVKKYNQNAIIDKNAIAVKTNDFIKERLVVITKDLSLLDRNVESFMIVNEITDVQKEAEMALSSNSSIEESIVDINTQLKLISYVSSYIKNNFDDLIPENLGLSDNSFASSTQIYNELLLERKRIKKSSGMRNPILINLDSELKNIRESMLQSLVNLESSLNISLKSLKTREKLMGSKIQSVPKQEREYRDLRRRQQIIETLYLYLLQKREENSISLAATTPNAKIIESVYGSNSPVNINPKKVYSLSLIVGFGIPFIIIFIILALDTKIHNIEDLERELKMPILGNIPKTALGNKFNIISKDDESFVAEAFRLFRTNLNFMLGVQSGPKSIFITSTISQEGKTFTTINLATVLVLANKKVLVVGADIRKPKLATYLNVPVQNGLTHFLMDTSLEVKNTIQHVESTGFDMIQAGVNAPNPAELLMNGRFKEILEYGKEHYDYVVVDTPPVNIVADTLLLSENKPDLVIYVVRANYLDKRLLKIPKKMYEEKRLPNMALLINGTDLRKGYGYAYGYGYGYGAESEGLRKGWYKKILKKINII
ncbi:polysaccharide biosynthesis tyrosine autokinase [Polaribacter litorisediminis]|uniref:GumC family protein n=1 Tax=Polaribacter litorisediminis TaxID=1908341 RepID=UPI001CC0E209|nr:polysaccharide biosynthesis tyrosine autokinase [Polaribacter litorisediminis]UAM97496.1 polysaccharide biosynthesis tyrosine autokinase [Polaribacter litorisediminis]